MTSIFHRKKDSYSEDVERLKNKVKEKGIDMEDVNFQVFNSEEEKKRMKIPAVENNISRLDAVVKELREIKKTTTEKEISPKKFEVKKKPKFHLRMREIFPLFQNDKSMGDKK